MSESYLFQTAVVTGASRGFGRAITAALVAAGTQVVGIARHERDLNAVRDELGEGFTPVAADATGEALAQDVIRTHRPGLLVLNAGAAPHMTPVHEHTWETFSRNWDMDTRHVFTWTRAALRQPLAPGSVVVTLSSGAVLGGSPLSGGYASAKAAIRYIRGYAADESQRAGLGIRFVTLLPDLTPAAASAPWRWRATPRARAWTATPSSRAGDPSSPRTRSPRPSWSWPGTRTAPRSTGSSAATG